MNIILEAVISATISNFMTNIKFKTNFFIFLLSTILASVVVES